MAADQRQRAVGCNPVSGTQLADHVGRCRSRASPGAGRLIAAGPYRPATRIQRAQRHTLLIGRKVQGMRTRSRPWPCPPSLGRLVQIQIRRERPFGAVLITMLDVTEQRIAGWEMIAQPLTGGVREGACAVCIDSVALGELLQIKLGDPLHRSADLVGNGAQPIFKTVVVAHAPHLGRCRMMTAGDHAHARPGVGPPAVVSGRCSPRGFSASHGQWERVAGSRGRNWRISRPAGLPLLSRRTASLQSRPTSTATASRTCATESR